MTFLKHLAYLPPAVVAEWQKPRTGRTEVRPHQTCWDEDVYGHVIPDWAEATMAWSLDVQRIDGEGAGISARRTCLLVDDEANAARQGDGEVWVGYEDGLARSDQADDLGTPGDGGLATATGGLRVRFHDVGSTRPPIRLRVATDDCH